MDHAFDNTPPSVDLLEKVMDAASTLLAPAVVWLGPRFFRIQDWSKLSTLGYLNHYLEDAAYAKWRKLKENPGSDWLAMTVNRFLVRDPYGETNPPRTANFEEQTPLWISPVWGLGTLVAKSVAAWGWPTRFTDYRHISLDDLAVLAVKDGGAVSTETVFSEDRILQFTEAGIIPLAGILRKDSAIMPKEALLSGGSLKFQLFFNRIVSFFFGLRERMGAEGAETDLGQTLEAAFSELFDRTGQQVQIEAAVVDGAAGFDGGGPGVEAQVEGPWTQIGVEVEAETHSDLDRVAEHHRFHHHMAVGVQAVVVPPLFDAGEPDPFILDVQAVPGDAVAEVEGR